MSNDPQKSSTFSVECPNKHVNYFDKYEECNRDDIVLREVSQKRLPMEELLLKCKTCGAEISVEIDCGGYRY
ncbi:MAG: hypothetical protein PVS3B3_33660 [Ktedonobacteraceae bacterium]